MAEGRNVNLKAAIFKSENTQTLIAKEIGMNRSMLSLLVMGRLVPTIEEKNKLSEILNVPVRSLFDE